MGGWMNGWVGGFMSGWVDTPVNTCMDVRIGKITSAVVGKTQWGQEGLETGNSQEAKIMVRKLIAVVQARNNWDKDWATEMSHT